MEFCLEMWVLLFVVSIQNALENYCNGCPNKSARFKARALSSPTTQQSCGGHLSDIVFNS